MARPDLTFLREQIDQVSGWRQEFQWLVDLNIKAEKAVNFGCNPAGKSLALMWAVGAEKILGIDANEEYVHREEVTLSRIQKDLNLYWSFLTDSDEPDDADVIWWNESVPEFFKQELTRDEFYIDFITRDITTFTGIPDRFFDFAFCDFMLHKIWWDDSRQHPKRDTRFAIGQMRRIVRQEGYVAVYEMVEQANNPPLDFRAMFEEMGLVVLHIQKKPLHNWRGDGVAASFLCRRS